MPFDWNFLCRKNMTPMMMKSIFLSSCHFCGPEPKSLKLLQQRMLYLHLPNQVYVLHLIEVSLMLCSICLWFLSVYVPDKPSYCLTATNKRICYLNISPDEVIRSLFYNKNNDSLITVSVYESDRFSSLKCRTTPIE